VGVHKGLPNTDKKLCKVRHMKRNLTAKLSGDFGPRMASLNNIKGIVGWKSHI